MAVDEQACRTHLRSGIHFDTAQLVPVLLNRHASHRREGQLILKAVALQAQRGLGRGLGSMLMFIRLRKHTCKCARARATGATAEA